MENNTDSSSSNIDIRDIYFNQAARHRASYAKGGNCVGYNHAEVEQEQK